MSSPARRAPRSAAFATLLSLTFGPAAALDLAIPEAHQDELTAPCATTGGADSCARVLACIGGDGTFFVGRALGWNTGTLIGRISDGTACTGAWAYGLLPAGAVGATLSCEDGRSGALIYTAQDPSTGTGIARGRMSDGTAVQAWTGENVLAFLTPDGLPRRAVLPCDDNPISIPVG